MPKQDRFSELISIYSALNRNEKETISIYTKAFQNRSHKDFKEIGGLIDLIDSDLSITRAQAAKALKIDKKPKLQQNLFILRTKDIVLECLTLTQNIDRPGEYSNQFRNRSVNLKRIEQAKIFLSRGERDIAEKLLGEVENRAEKYELFDQLLEAKELLKISYSTYRAARTINRYKAEITRAIELNRCLHQAKNIYAEFLFHLKREEDNADSQKELLTALKELETKSRSATIGFLRAMAEVTFLLKNEKYQSAIELMNALVENRLYSPPLQSNQGVSELKIEIGRTQVLLGDFQAARNSFSAADKLVKNDTYESYINRKNLVLLDFYESNLQSLEEEIDKRISSFYTSRIPYASAFYHFSKAIWLISKNQSAKAAEILTAEIEAIGDTSEKERFHRNVYLFIAGHGIQEAKKRTGNNYCNKALENLSKMKKNNMTERERLIITVFNQIKSAGYDVKRFLTLNAKQLEKLESDSPALRWTPLSDEIIPVQNWIHNQVDKRKKLNKIS
jgi:tetratricopeptide (TPR) repeat protein